MIQENSCPNLPQIEQENGRVLFKAIGAGKRIKTG